MFMHVDVFFFFLLEKVPLHLVEPSIAAETFQCGKITSGHHSFQTTRGIRGGYKTSHFCSDMHADSACLVQMSFTEFPELVYFFFLVFNFLQNDR